ncbi:MAG: hypothetical protein KF760_23010 [Candidatus Eremiobacteraeota bacterium]|nr:hypothetical protein [Candidatus Eremiobacteraeota bacterium]MCW5868382.1 hypothetical protein [Candidatus Eremiobacteraeota bacterium]
MDLQRHARALAASRRLLRSPLYAQKKPLPGGQALYTYERSLWPQPLEQVEAPAGWEAEKVVCSSRGGAFATLLTSLRDLLERPLSVRCWDNPGYVELEALLECLAPGRWSWAWRRETMAASLRHRRAELFLLGADQQLALLTTGAVVLDRLPDQDFWEQYQGWLLILVQPEAPLVGCQPYSLSLYGRVSQQPGLSSTAMAAELARRVRSVLGVSLSYTRLWESCAPAGAAAASPILPPPRAWPPPPGYQGEEAAYLKELAKWRLRTLARADRSRPLPLPELEKRLLAYDQAPDGWELQPMLFSSAMAALSALSLLMPRVQSQAAYFETQFLRQVLRQEEACDVAWFESVRYDWELTPWDLKIQNRPAVLVLDTTLTGQRLRLGQVLQQHRPQLAVRVFSALKLDQRGQELENCGAVLLAGPPEIVGAVRQGLERLRSLLGTLPGCARLSPDWILRPNDGHAEAVLQNNAWLAARLRPGGLLQRVVHPRTLGAPFVVLHCQHPHYIAAALERESRRRALPFARGASFGFVAHRHEYVIPVLRDQRILYKVAMGSSPGPSRQGVLELLQEVFAHSDLNALRRSFPGLRPAPPARDWSAPSQRMLDFLAGSP